MLPGLVYARPTFFPPLPWKELVVLGAGAGVGLGFGDSLIWDGPGGGACEAAAEVSSGSGSRGRRRLGLATTVCSLSRGPLALRNTVMTVRAFAHESQARALERGHWLATR